MQVKVRLTVEEQELAAARAAAAGMSLSRFVADCALEAAEATTPVVAAVGRGRGTFRMPAPERQAWATELMAVRRIVAVVANNINQVAKVGNSTGELPAEHAGVNGGPPV